MADFTTHITTSTAVGAFYGVAGHVYGGVPIPTCMVAAGLCSVAGMLPDVDSDSGRPQREVLNFAAAVIPMLMIGRFLHMGLSSESMVLAGGCIYVLIRFGLGGLLKRFTVHRGMWHSIPAAVIAGLVASLICSGDMSLKLFKIGAVVLGYVIHLVLDELWAIEWRRGRLRLKSSSGTALKFFGRGFWPNAWTYGKLVAVGLLALGDPMIMESLGADPHQVHEVARDWLDQILGQTDTSILR